MARFIEEAVEDDGPRRSIRRAMSEENTFTQICRKSQRITRIHILGTHHLIYDTSTQAKKNRVAEVSFLKKALLSRASQTIKKEIG